MSEIRAQYIYTKNAQNQLVRHLLHPQTEAAAIIDLFPALDSFSDQYIKPIIDQKISGIELIEGPQGPAGADGRTFSTLGRFDTLLELLHWYPTGQEGEAWSVGPESGPTTVFVWDVHEEVWKKNRERDE